MFWFHACGFAILMFDVPGSDAIDPLVEGIFRGRIGAMRLVVIVPFAGLFFKGRIALVRIQMIAHLLEF